MKTLSYSRLITTIGFSLLAASAHAEYTFQIDSFFVFKNVIASDTPEALLANAPIFMDDFSNGYVPGDSLDTHTFSNGNTATYSVAGSTGPEENGKLGLSLSGMVDNGYGTLRTNVNLNSNTSTDPNLGLKSASDNFFVVGVWDLMNPANHADGMGSYGVRFNDSFNGVTGNDIISLAVRGATNGGAVVSFLHFDNVSGKSDFLDLQVLDTSHQQIGLGLGYLDTDGDGTKEVGAGYFYLDNGVITGYSTFDATTTIFHGEEWTRASFFATNSFPAAVPEPADYALMLVGLAMIGFVVRRRQT